jgi:hypothetical protein
MSFNNYETLSAFLGMSPPAPKRLEVDMWMSYSGCKSIDVRGKAIPVHLLLRVDVWISGPFEKRNEGTSRNAREHGCE